MNVRFLVLLVPFALVAACGSETADAPAADAGFDAAADAAPTGPHCLGKALPEVAPSGKSCPPNTDDKKCVAEGWSCISGWWPQWPEVANVEGDPYTFGGPSKTPQASPLMPVYLDPFQMDTFEVSNANFAAALGGAILPPPDLCDLEVPADADPDYGLPRPPPVRLRSGWSAGKIGDARPDRPVTCITRASAEAYCEGKGGRLPTAFEFAKATRALAPDIRPYPAHPFAATLVPYDPFDYGTSGYAAPRTNLKDFEPVNEVQSATGWPKTADWSPWGIGNLAGNVSEHLCTCAEGRSGFSWPLVRPAVDCKARCQGGIASGGGNAMESNGDTAAAIGVLPTLGDSYDATTNPITDRFHQWSLLSPDPTFNEHHDPRIGFRCVYEVK